MKFSKSQIVKFCTEALKETRNIPTVKGLPLIGDSISILRAGGPTMFHLYADKKHKELGPIFRINTGLLKAVFLSDTTEMKRVFSLEGKYPAHFLPESWELYNTKFHKKRGIFFMEGEEWLCHRKILNKHLLKEDITTELSSVYNSIVQGLIKRWSTHLGSEIPNLEHELYRHSITIVLGTVIGSSYNDVLDCFEHDLDFLASSFCKIFEITGRLNAWPVKLASALHVPIWKEFVRACDTCFTENTKVLERIEGKCSEDGLLMKLKSDNISADIVKAIILDFILAAGDTTGFTTQWALYLLAQDSGIQDKIAKEVGGSYMLARGAMKEALRLYPAAVFLSRRLAKPAKILGYDIFPEDMIFMSLYTSGRSENNFKDPEIFRPERWDRSSESRDILNANAFLTFAHGTRSCVGRRIAEYSMTKTISEVVKNYNLQLLEEVEMILKLVPVPKNPIRIKITPRKLKE